MPAAWATPCGATGSGSWSPATGLGRELPASAPLLLLLAVEPAPPAAAAAAATVGVLQPASPTLAPPPLLLLPPVPAPPSLLLLLLLLLLPDMLGPWCPWCAVVRPAWTSSRSIAARPRRPLWPHE